MMEIKIVIFYLCFISFNNLNAQINVDKKEKLSMYGKYNGEIGLSNSPTYLFSEAVLAFGINVHYIRAIPLTMFGIGISYEQLLSKGIGHSTFAIVGALRTNEHIIFNISPGLKIEGKKSKRFAMQIESIYEWEINRIHFGPAIEFALSQQDFHLSLGLHTSLCF